jgi:hypothetical protein
MGFKMGNRLLYLVLFCIVPLHYEVILVDNVDSTVRLECLL